MPGGPVASGPSSSTNLEWNTQVSNTSPHSGNGHVSFSHPPVRHIQDEPQASNAQQHIVQLSNWESGMGTPPMPQKRKKKKKEKKKDKKGKKVISAPLNVRHVGMTEMLDQLQNQSKFPVEHIATMSMEEQLASLSPYDSLRNVKALLQRGNTWTKPVLLCVTSTALTVKDGATKMSVFNIPLVSIVRCQFLQDPGTHSSVLMVAMDDHSGSKEPRVHFFQCSKTPAEVICKEIELARESAGQAGGSDVGRQRRVGVSDQQSVDDMRSNWILQAPPPPPPSTAPPSIPETLPPPSSSPPHLPSFLQEPSPPPPLPPSQLPPSSLPPPTLPTYNQPYYGNQLPAGSPSPAVPGQALPHTTSEDSASVGSAGTPSHHVRDIVKTASNRSVTQSRSQAESGESSEIRRTMKASRIQRDVDILNHVIEDLENFLQVLKRKAAAWSELEKKKKKSKRKKHDAALEVLRMKAEPPSDEEVKDAYSKCKLALNLAAKLGHHLSSPSASQMQAGIFSSYISRYVSLINKGAQLASTVVSPVLTQQAIELMKKKLPAAENAIWQQLGTNWFLSIEQWPAGAPSPPEYEIRFSDGCVPPNLHNSSDCPANFPTLDTLPREKRYTVEYSDAYDMANQPEAESGLLINPAVKAAVESQFAVTPAIPDIVQKKGMRKTSSQHSLSSQGSQAELSRTARVLFDYTATNHQELSVYRGERVEVLDSSLKWWKVKNIHGQVGHLPGNQLEVIQPKKKNEVPEGTDMIDVHGRRVPAPPRKAPPPVPSPNARRPSISNIKYSPQPVHLSRKVSQQSHLSPLPEVSESCNSTMSRPHHHPPLPPPPSFSPALPHQNSYVSGAPPPPHPPGAGGPPPPPPPPPVVPQKAPMSLNEILAQHKLKSKQGGKTRKASVVQKGMEDNQFDITEALKTRKPLRKTTRANLMGGAGSGGRGSEGQDLQQQLQKKLREKKLSTIEQEEPDMEYCVLPWKADQQAIKGWLVDQGYGSCADRLGKQVQEGSQLYCMDREALKDMFGSLDGVRLYSQLQKDKPESEKNAGVAKETDFQKMMRVRKATLDHSGTRGEEPTILKLRRPPQGIRERETVVDGPLQRSFRGRTESAPRSSQRYRGDNTTPRRRGQDDYDSQSLHRRRKLSEDYEQAGRGSRSRRGDGQRSRRSSHYSDPFSDDEEYRMRKRKSGRSQRSSRYSDSQSDGDDHSRRRRGRRGRGSRRRRKPTNIDDFDENDFSDTESDSDSSYSSDFSGSDSDSEREKRHRLRSSASASAVPDAVWALQGQPQQGVDSEARVKSQQAEIKRLLNELGEIQKKSGIKTLPAEKQKTLQQDLKYLEHLQLRLKGRPGNDSILTQLIGQQILLSDHLRDAIDCVKVKGLTLSTSPGSLQFHLMQQQQQQQQALAQQAAAQQQQRMLLEAEQQQQLLLAAAEQQRQLQLAQMASQHQQLLGLQSPGYGVQTLGGMYNPAYVGMTYF